jgi:ABC-type nickel/cobalt efflux system permease component RcnA
VGEILILISRPRKFGANFVVPEVDSSTNFAHTAGPTHTHTHTHTHIHTHTYTHTHRHNHTWFPALNSSGLSQLVFIEEPHPNPPHSEPSAWDTCFMGLGNQ